MISKVRNWLSSIDKHHSLGKVDKVVRDLRALCGVLAASKSPVRSNMKTHIITRIQGLLSHESVDVIRATINVMISLIDDIHALPQDVTVTLMMQAKKVLSSGVVNDRTALTCEMLFHLLADNPENKQSFCSSGCLEHILCVFTRIDLSENLQHIKWLINVIISSMSNNNRIAIGSAVIPTVLSCLNIWLSTDNPAAEVTTALKELIFVCRVYTSDSKECQNMVLQNRGLESLLSALQSPIMKDHVEIILTRESGFVDYSPTLFSSLVILLDAVVTHNKEACQRAMELNVIDILKQYLNIVPVPGVKQQWQEQRIFIVDTIVHILEADEVISSSPWTTSLLNEIFYIIKDTACPADVLKYLQSKQHIEGTLSKTNCTPHPKKSLSLKHRPADRKLDDKACQNKYKSTPHPNKSICLKHTLCDNNISLDAEGVDVNTTTSVDTSYMALGLELPEIADQAQNQRSYQNTPYPNRNISLQKPLKRLGRPVSEEPKFESCLKDFHTLKALKCEADSCSKKYKKYFFSQAELLLLMHCVHIYGLNMDNIRCAYPFHKELTPADLYTLWRAMWNKKKPRKFI